MPTDLQKAKKIHLVGIKGVGMTALAHMLAGRNKNVSGSDTSEKFFTDDILKRLRIKTYQGFYPKNIDPDTDLLISSAAYCRKKDNIIMGIGNGGALIQHVLTRGIPVLTYPEAIAQMFNTSFGIAVAGTHGKSTTSAMAAVMLEHCNKDPQAVIGTKVLNWQANARTSRSTLRKVPFVLEADEYRDAFLHYNPNIIILTNIEWDHPDYFKTFVAYKNSFAEFTKKLKGLDTLIYCADDPRAYALSSRMRLKSKIGYGFSPQSQLRIISWALQKEGTSFTVMLNQKNLGVFSTQLFGAHNVLNATAVIALGISMGLSIKKIRKGIARFQGTARRFEIVARKPHLIIDDYAHHPSEIAATIAGAKNAWPEKRITVVFQPHTFSRTEALFNDFVKALATADRCFILKTYASARETDSIDTGGKKLADSLHTAYFKTIGDAQGALPKTLMNNDVLITMGAGDVWRVGTYLRNVVK